MRDPDFEWDDVKALRNHAQHGVAFDAIRLFDWASSVTDEDRRGHPERRFVSLGLVGDRLHVAVWTVRLRGDRVRLISIRKANAREVRRYQEKG